MSLFTRIRMVLTGLAIAAGLCAPAHARQAISNTAQLSFETDAGTTSVASNTTVLSLTPHSRPHLRLLRLAGQSGGDRMTASESQCLLQGKGFVAPGVSGDSEFDPDAVDLRPATSFHAGEPIFIEIVAPDAVHDPSVREFITITLKTTQGDEETLKIHETSPASGRFLGYIPATDTLPPKKFDCELFAPRGHMLNVSILDELDGSVTWVEALIDPYGYVFDSRTGKPVDGARVTLIDQSTGLPAQVFGDDGVSVYPSTVISGEDVVDASGVVYQSAAGQYRFPQTRAGRYSLFVEPPIGYAAPSTATEAQLAKLSSPDGEPFVIVDASWGKPFDLTNPDPLQIDIPLDSGVLPNIIRRFVQGLSMEKFASVRKATFGDVVGYTLTVRNIGAAATVQNVVIEDHLPRGLRYVRGSSRRDGQIMPEPTLSADGRTLTWPLGVFGPSGASMVSYMTNVGADTPVGEAVNRASASGAAGAYSGEAQARVSINAALMEDAGTIVGRVTEGACAKDRKTGRLGVAGVRLVMEDGTFVISDRDGLFHFEGVRPGMHVVQLDADALPDGLEAVACGRNTRLAGRAFSQFVDMRGGALQRVEFRLRRTASTKVDTAKTTDIADISDDTAPGVIDWFAGRTSAAPSVIYPAAGHNPAAPATRVAVLHAPGQKVALTINGAPVDALARDGVDTSADGAMAVSLWRGVPLVEGSNTLVATVTNAAGDVVATVRREVAYANTPARADLVPEASHLTADGLSNPVVAVRFTDRFGHPVRPGTIGTFDIAAPYAPAPDPQANQRLAGEGNNLTTWRVTGDDGVARIALAPTTQAGSAVLRFALPGLGEGPPAEVRAWMSASREDWIVVGFAAGTAGFNTLSRHASPLARADRGKTMTDGQVAFYAKGRVRGSWLLTMAYDNKRPAELERGLTSQIDPDRYYTVYGDGSAQAYDAASQRKLYLRLEKDAFYALFGDFRTGFDASHLGRYDRAMNGGKFERQGKVFSVSGFAAETTQDHVRDELPGSGLAGLYQLSRRDIVPNTETLSVETRDRARPERILASHALVRNIDYDINYDTGALSFRDPILSRDENLNPNVVVVNYEVLGNGERSLEAGARVQADLAKGKVKAGVTYLHGRPGPATHDTDVIATDLTLRPTKDTEVRLEAATSQAVSTQRQNAFIAEVEHHSGRIDVLGYARQADADFGLDQQNRAELGARKVGVDGKARITDRLTLNATAYHENYLDSAATRDVADVRVDYKLDTSWFGLGLKSAHDTPETAPAQRSDLVTVLAGREFFDRRLQVTASSDIALGDAESTDFPARRRLGASFQVREGVRLLASHEIIEGVGYKAAVTGGGVEVAPWTGGRVTTALNQQDLSAFGPRTYAQLGFTQSVQLKGGWTLDGSLDSAKTIAGQAPDPSFFQVKGLDRGLSTEDYTAVSLGAAFRADLWSANGRVETRQGSLADSWAVRGAYLRQLREGVTAGLTLRADETKTVSGGVSRGTEVSGMLAWRPIDSQWSVLDRLDVRGEEARGVVQGTGTAGYGLTARDAGQISKVINNLAINYDSDRGDHGPWAVQASLYHGAKLVKAGFEGQQKTSFVQVLGGELRVDVTERIDIGLNASVRDGGKDGGRAFAIGPSIGISPAENTWIAVGWNAVGYHDPDFEASRYSRQGFYVSARVKFDQNTFAGLGQKMEGLGLPGMRK